MVCLEKKKEGINLHSSYLKTKVMAFLLFVSLFPTF